MGKDASSGSKSLSLLSRVIGAFRSLTGTREIPSLDGHIPEFVHKIQPKSNIPLAPIQPPHNNIVSNASIPSPDGPDSNRTRDHPISTLDHTNQTDVNHNKNADPNANIPLNETPKSHSRTKIDANVAVGEHSPSKSPIKELVPSSSSKSAPDYSILLQLLAPKDPDQHINPTEPSSISPRPIVLEGNLPTTKTKQNKSMQTIQVLKDKEKIKEHNESPSISTPKVVPAPKGIAVQKVVTSKHMRSPNLSVRKSPNVVRFPKITSANITSPKVKIPRTPTPKVESAKTAPSRVIPLKVTPRATPLKATPLKTTPPRSTPSTRSKTRSIVPKISSSQQSTPSRPRTQSLIEGSRAVATNSEITDKSPKRKIDWDYRDIEDITNTKGKLRKKRVKISKNSLRILPSDDELESPQVIDLDKDWDTNDMEASEKRDSEVIEEVLVTSMQNTGEATSETQINTNVTQENNDQGYLEEAEDKSSLEKNETAGATSDIVKNGNSNNRPEENDHISKSQGVVNQEESADRNNAISDDKLLANENEVLSELQEADAANETLNVEHVVSEQVVAEQVVSSLQTIEAKEKTEEDNTEITSEVEIHNNEQLLLKQEMEEIERVNLEFHSVLAAISRQQAGNRDKIDTDVIQQHFT